MGEAATQAKLGWQARLELDFVWREDRTVLARNRHFGPLLVQKPFYPEGPDLCQIYLVHPPGGVAGGDELKLEAKLDSGAKALLTTPAATKFYRSAGACALMRQRFRLEPGAWLEWLPQESIVHSGALCRAKTVVDLAHGAEFFGWEIVCLGLAASNDPFVSGSFSQGLEIRREGLPVLAELARYEAGQAMLNQAYGLAGKTVSGSLVATKADGSALRAARDYLQANQAGNLCAASLTEDGLCVRLLADDSSLAKRIFQGLWEALRPLTLGRAACPPRIWST